MPGKIKQGQSIFIPFRNGMSIYDSQNKARMYMSVEKFKASFPAFRLGTEDIELVEYAPVRHGQWEPRKDVIGFVRCSVCHDCNIYGDWADGEKWRYCPNCGAKMEG